MSGEPGLAGTASASCLGPVIVCIRCIIFFDVYFEETRGDCAAGWARVSRPIGYRAVRTPVCCVGRVADRCATPGSMWSVKRSPYVPTPFRSFVAGVT